MWEDALRMMKLPVTFNALKSVKPGKCNLFQLLKIPLILKELFPVSQRQSACLPERSLCISAYSAVPVPANRVFLPYIKANRKTAAIPLQNRTGSSENDPEHPAHLLLHSSGVLLSVYGHRENPFGIRVIASRDYGKSWSAECVLFAQGINADIGYPCSVERTDGSILTVFYTHDTENSPAVIKQLIWRLEE